MMRKIHAAKMNGVTSIRLAANFSTPQSCATGKNYIRRLSATGRFQIALRRPVERTRQRDHRGMKTNCKKLGSDPLVEII